MATYATIADFEAYVEGWTTDDAAALERLLLRAERDVDSILGPIPTLDSGLKLDPTQLQDWEVEALARAVCAQALHRFRYPELFGATVPERTVKSVSGPEFSQTYEDATDPALVGTGLFSPRVALELRALSHLRGLSGHARA